jgi:hypothetical protein
MNPARQQERRPPIPGNTIGEDYDAREEGNIAEKSKKKVPTAPQNGCQRPFFVILKRMQILSEMFLFVKLKFRNKKPRKAWLLSGQNSN